MNNQLDIKFMNLALNIAKKNIGITGKNPSVGCVIAKDREIISTGVTDLNGRPHAEVIAIDKINDKEILKKSSIYITLEPCFKENEIDGCCNYILKHKIPRVVITMSDPNKKIDYRSINKLKENDVEVIVGTLKDESLKINEFFTHYQINNKPFISLKIATSLDGKIATKSGDSKWITGEEARRYSHYLRSIYDAILIGKNTLISDNPQLSCRVKGLEDFSPKIIILANSLNLDNNLNIFNQDKTQIIIASNEKNEINQNFNKKNISIISYKDSNDFLIKISELGIKSILVEGGSYIASWMIENNMIDRLIWIRNNKIIGNDGIPAIKSLNIEKIDDAISVFKRKSVKLIDDDIIEILDKN